MDINYEIWSDINGFEGRYQVSTYGRVRRLHHSGQVYIFKMQINKDGYYTVYITRDYRTTVHRLVAMTFIPNTENKPTVNHKDGNRKNNNVNNLEWATWSENSQHAQDSGRLGRLTCTIYNPETNEKYDSIKQFAKQNRLPYKYVAQVIKKTGSWKGFSVIEKAMKN